MTDISRRFEEFIKSANKKLAKNDWLIPLKTDQGILVGDVLIVNHQNLKTVILKDQIYKDIYLNLAAVKIANLLALRRLSSRIEDIYQSDQEYGRWFVDSQHLLYLHRRSLDKKDFDRADMLWAKYQESRDRAKFAKEKVDQLLF